MRIFVVLAWAEGLQITIKEIGRECVTRAPFLKASGAVEVLSFGGTNEDQAYCGLLPLELYSAKVGETHDLLALPSSKVPPLGFCANVAALEATKAVVFGEGYSADLAMAILEAKNIEATLVTPPDAPGFEPQAGMYIDLSGAETIRHSDYISLLSPAAEAALDNGIFAGLDLTPIQEIDIPKATALLDPVLPKVLEVTTKPKSAFLVPPVLKRDIRAFDEYLSFLAWGRDADNRGRRMGLDRFYDDNAMRSLLEDGPHTTLLDKIHDVTQNSNSLHQPSSGGNVS